jgi:DNA modification methylase
MIRLLEGDCRAVLPTLASDSVHCCVTSVPYYGLRMYLPDGHPDKHLEIGLEASADEWLATLVAVFAEVRRVLRPDGVLWLNVGDSYSSGSNGDRRLGPNDGTWATARQRYGAKPKDLMMLPARLALALQADGWWLRSDIIWHKPNPMPESATDRPTSAHEHVFMLAKSARYYFDQEAVREQSAYPDDDRKARSAFTDKRMPTDMIAGMRPGSAVYPTRNMRNVWDIPTEAFPGAHFATFPTALVERCIKAGTSERGCCAQCGKPWVRQTETKGGTIGKKGLDYSADRGGRMNVGVSWPPLADYQRTTTGWAPSCKHDAGVVPATVLDPFIGSGTTALVADRLQRHAIGIDLSTSYAQMALDRIQHDAPLLVEIAAEAPIPEPQASLWEWAAQ